MTVAVVIASQSGSGQWRLPTFLDSASGSPVTQYVWARFQNYRPPHPHNGLLDLLGQLGVVGVVAFAYLLFFALRHGLGAALRGSATARTGVIVLSFILVFGATEPTYLDNWLIITVMAVAMVAPRPLVRPADPLRRQTDRPRLPSRTP